MRNLAGSILTLAAISGALLLIQPGCQQQSEPTPAAEPEVAYRSMEDLAPEPEPMPMSPETVEMSPAPAPIPVYAPTPTPAPEPAPAGPTQYTVRKDDTLWSIAVRTLGSGRRWREIQAINGGIDPTKLQVGQVLLIPPE